MPWDTWIVSLPANESSKIRAVVITNQRGGTGNKLFAIAAGVAFSHAFQLPLFFNQKVSQTMAARGFPCLRSSRGLHGVSRTRIEPVLPNMLFGINFQDVATWGTPEPSLRPARATTARWLDVMRRTFRPRAGGFELAPEPGPDDLVLHFRDLRDCNGWQRRRDAQSNASSGERARSVYRVANAASKWFYDLDFLYSPPLAFYESAIDAHLTQFPGAHVWVVCLPCDREHPTLRELARRRAGVLRFLTAHGSATICDRGSACKVPPVLDLLWMQTAQHLVLSPSTFGWWAAFLSVRVKTVHYPVLPQFSPWGPTMWCHLLPEDDARYVFHDPWANVQWRGGTRTGHGARRRCDVYMRACLHAHACARSEASAAAARRALPLDGIDEFTTYVERGHELEGWTSAELEAAARRHNVSIAGSSSVLDAVAASPAAASIRAEARAFLSGRNRAPFVKAGGP